MQSELGICVESMLKKRNVSLDNLKLNIDSPTKQKLVSSPEKVNGKIIGAFFKAINITANEYSQFTLLVSQVLGCGPSRQELAWIEDFESLISKEKLKRAELCQVIEKLLGSDEIIENLSYDELYGYHLKFASYISYHLMDKLNLNAQPIFESEKELVRTKYFSLPRKERQEKFERFLYYFQHILEVRDNDILMNDKKKSFELYLDKFKWVVPDREKIFNLLDTKDVFLEVYDNNCMQIYRSPDFATITNHSIMKLETYEWWELFERSQANTELQQKVLEKIFSGEHRQPIYNPLPKHKIREIDSSHPLEAEVESLVYCPFYCDRNEFQGGLHVFKYRII